MATSKLEKGKEGERKRGEREREREGGREGGRERERESERLGELRLEWVEIF